MEYNNYFNIKQKLCNDTLKKEKKMEIEFFDDNINFYKEDDELP